MNTISPTHPKEQKQAPPSWARDGHFQAESQETEAAIIKNSEAYTPEPSVESQVFESEAKAPLLIGGMSELRFTPPDEFRKERVLKELSNANPTTLKDTDVAKEISEKVQNVSKKAGKSAIGLMFDIPGAIFDLKEYLLVGLGDKKKEAKMATPEAQKAQEKVEVVKLNIHTNEQAKQVEQGQKMAETQRLLEKAGLAGMSDQEFNKARGGKINLSLVGAKTPHAIEEVRLNQLKAKKEQEEASKASINSGKGKTATGQPKHAGGNLNLNKAMEDKASGISAAG